jgi:hypothetical protein
MKTRPERDPQHTAQSVYTIPCEGGRSYIDETGRPLAVRLQGLLEKSKLAQHAYEEGHTTCSEDARILEIESNSRYILCDCEAVAHLRFRHLGQFFMELSDYYDAPIHKVLHFIRGVGLIKG